VTGSQPGSRGNMNRLCKRQETLLAILGQERTPIYSSTRKAVLRPKCPIRGIDKAVHHDGYVVHQGMME
jgi:hypothetical protein